MKFLTFLMLFSVNLQASPDFWDTEFPDHIDKFIYEQTHFKCAYSDYIDSAMAVEILEFEMGRTYIVDFSVYDDLNGFIAVDETFEGDLYLGDLDCPQI